MAKKASKARAAGVADGDATTTARTTTSSTAASTSSVEALRDATQTTASAMDQPDEPLLDIVVNKWSLHELKTACDDAVKQHLSRPSQFTPSHMHTDVRLALGWTASFVAIGATLYAYKVPFKQSRDYVLAAVGVYILLSGILAAYVRYVEKDTIFEGRRKVAAGRIETQALSVRSSCKAYSPVYHLHFAYTHSSNAGKSLIREFKKDVSKPFAELFDDEGRLVRHELEKTLQKVITEATGQQ